MGHFKNKNDIDAFLLYEQALNGKNPNENMEERDCPSSTKKKICDVDCHNCILVNTPSYLLRKDV